MFEETAVRVAFFSADEEVAWIEESLRTEFANRSYSIEVLEAGCGRRWHLDRLRDLPIVLTGVDLDAAALRIRKDTIGDLDCVVIGDVRDDSLFEQKFDLIYSAYVLEHVPDAQTALQNFHHWLNPAGLIVLRIPDRRSIFAFVARHTPHVLHVWFYRYALGDRNAGRPGHTPYPVVYDEAIGLDRIVKLFVGYGYAVIGTGVCRPFPGKRGLLWSIVRTALKVGQIVTRGGLVGSHNNISVILKKR